MTVSGARLFGFFTSAPVTVAEIDKASGATSNAATMTGVEVPAAWAFSFWGGDFYLYTSDGLSNSKVVHYAPGPNTVDLSYVPDEVNCTSV